MIKVNGNAADFQRLFPDEDVCLEIIFREKYGTWTVCPICLSKNRFFRVKKRKCYACQSCSYQIHPLANTIYHKSSTPLPKWFRAIYLFSKSSTISARELQTQINVTYKTAWRILKQIRSLQSQRIDLNRGKNISETYIQDLIRRNRRRV